MTKWLIPGVLLVALVGAWVVWTALQPPVQHIQCDGSLPRWMLYAQDYDGSGCAEVLPSSEAPPNADWTPYCMGMCAEFDEPGPWPPED